MGMRIPASMRTREALSALIEGRLASPAGRSELVELATRLIVEEALEGEVRDALDRGYYERGDAPGQGHRNGHRTHRLKTAEGGLEYSAPQVAGLAPPFRSALRDHLKGHTEALESLAVEMLARGLSVRDIEDAFRDETGRLLLSRTAVAEIGKQLWEDYQPSRAAISLSTTSRSVHRWDRRADPLRSAARAGPGRLGRHLRRPQGAPPPDGRVEGGR